MTRGRPMLTPTSLSTSFTPGPATKRITLSARERTLPVLHTLRRERYSDAVPYRVLDIPTQRITHMQQHWEGPVQLPWMKHGRNEGYATLRRRWHAGIVLDGDWDEATVAFDDYHLARVLHKRFHRGLEWEQIPYIRKALRKVDAGERAWGGRCRTAADVHARCAYLDDLHHRLSTQGYRPDRADTGKLTFTHFLVNIGRDGTIIRNNDGKHRILLSRIIGIPTLQARVLVRHRHWQQVRNAIRAGDRTLAARFADHPDLADLADLAP